MQLDERQKKILQLKDNTDLILFKEIEKLGKEISRLDDEIPDFNRILSAVKGRQGDKGEKGEDGYTPIKGKDYFDGEKPVKGIDFEDGKDGAPGKDGKEGKDGINGRDGIDGKDGKDGEDYVLTEEDKTEISELVVIPKMNINDLDGLKDFRIDVSRINNLPIAKGGRTGGGTTEILDSGNKVISTHRLNFGSNLTVTEVNGIATINATGGGGGSISGTDTHVVYFDGDDNATGDADFTWNKTTDTLKVDTMLLHNGGDDNSLFLQRVKFNSVGTSNVFFTNGADSGTATIGSNNAVFGGTFTASSTLGNNNSGVGISFAQGAGSNNTTLGHNSGGSLVLPIGDFNTSLGTESNNPFGTYDSTISIGYRALPNADNQLVIGRDVVNGEITDMKIGINQTETNGMIRYQQGTGMTLDEYGSGTITGTAAYTLGVTADGLVVETTGGVGGGLDNVVEDLTPQLGGNLDVNGFTITSASAGDVVIAPSGAGILDMSAGAGGVDISTTSGNSDITLDPHGTGVTSVVGNLTVSGTVDGRDVATDGTKLDGIEASADVTDETNVVSALDGATLTSVTPAESDEILIQDSSDSDNLKTVTYSDIRKRQDVLRLTGSDMISALAVRDDLDYITLPYDGTFDDLEVTVFTAPTGAGITVDMELNGATIFSTKPTIDATEKTSDDATTAYVLSTTTFSAGDILVLNLDGVGSTETGRGLNVMLSISET